MKVAVAGGLTCGSSGSIVEHQRAPVAKQERGGIKGGGAEASAAGDGGCPGRRKETVCVRPYLGQRQADLGSSSRRRSKVSNIVTGEGHGSIAELSLRICEATGTGYGIVAVKGLDMPARV